MNLFILSLIQKEIAEYMMDKHVSKILLEAVQMLCTAKRVVDPNDIETNNKLYKLAHKNHPVTIWCRTSRENYVWTLDLIDELHNEWRYRYGHPTTKIHKAYLVAQILKENIPDENKTVESNVFSVFTTISVELLRDAIAERTMFENCFSVNTWKKRILFFSTSCLR